MGNRLQSSKIGNTIRIDSEIEWQYTYFEEEKKWFAFCDILKIAIQSDSLKELQQDMLECADTLFSELSKTGELEGFLKSRGWVVKQLPPKSEKSTVDLSVRFRRVEEHDLQEEFC
jgi:hypothetical protein